MNDTKLAELKAQIFKLPKSSTPLFPYGERRQLVADLLEEIQFLRDQEYSYEFISEFIGEESGISIKPKTLRRYFFEERAKLKQEQPTGQRRRKASPSRFPFRSSQVKPANETSAAELKPKKVKAKVAKAPAEPEPEPQPEPEAEAEEEVWGVNMDDDDDDSYTTGLINEPTFNRIRRS